jgi:hypothetical protein
MTEQNMSLFIPAVFKNISAERIISAFEKVKLGKVSYVNFLDKNEKFNSVHVCFSYWRNTEAVYNFQKKAKSSEGAKLVYDDPWHWVVLEYKKKPEHLTSKNKMEQDLYQHIDYINEKLCFSKEKCRKAYARIDDLEAQLREYEHTLKIYTDEIISLKQKIIIIEEGEEDERRANT